MDVAINEAWDDGHSSDVVFGFAFIAFANSDDAVIFDGNIAFFDFTIEEIDVFAVFKKNVAFGLFQSGFDVFLEH